jgi:protein-tyrosine phosphatase
MVCLGNICRSPMAEAVLRHKLRLAGLESKVIVDSAGTGNWHAGEPPHVGTRRVLEINGVSWEGITARQIRLPDLVAFDYILTMDDDNLQSVQRLGKATGTVACLLSFVPDLVVTEVPDPYYDGRFSEVYDLLDAACDGFIQHLTNKGDR